MKLNKTIGYNNVKFEDKHMLVDSSFYEETPTQITMYEGELELESRIVFVICNLGIVFICLC
jgi:hypothetical protein